MLVAGLVVVCALLNPCWSAAARPPRAIVLGPGHTPAIDVDAGGVAHVAFAADVPGSAEGEQTVAYCRLAAAGPLSCAPRNALVDGGSAGPVHVNPIRVGATGGPVAIASCRINRAGDLGEAVAAWVFSVDGGTSFSAPLDLGHKTSCLDGAFGPDGAVTLAGSVIDTTVLHATLGGPPATANASVLPGGLSEATVDYYGRRPVVVSARLHGDLHSSIWSGLGDANNGATWSTASRNLGRYDAIDLDAGPRGLYLIGQKHFGTKVVVHRFNGQRFGRGVVLTSRRRSALGGPVVLAQDGHGRLLALWQERKRRLLWAAASRDGRRWSPPLRLARGTSLHPGKLEAALTPGGRGVAVWGDGKRLLAARLNLGHILRGRR